MKNKINIIGSGIGGLFTGALLAKHGFLINVFEEKDKIGGYASSWQKGGFTFEASLHSMNGFETDIERHKTFKFLNLFDKLKMLKISSAYTSLFENYQFRAPDNYEDFTNSLIKEFPEEEKQIKKVLLKIKKIALELTLIPTIKSKILFYLLLPIKFPNILFNLNTTLFKLINKRFKNPKLITIITQLYSYYSNDIKNLNLLYFSGPTYSFINGGYWISGTSAKLSNALKEIIEENGGKVLTNKKVIEIIFNEQNKAAGLRTSDGKEYYSDLVICNNSIKDVFENLVSNKKAPLRLKNKALNTISSTSVFTLYMGMNIDAKKIGLNDYSYFFNELDVDADINMINNRLDYEKRPVTMVAYNLDDSLAPKGKSVIMACTLDSIEYWEKFSDDKEKYNAEKERVSGIILDRIEKEFPDFRKHIEILQIATPMTMRRYTGNPDGAIYGACQRVSQAHINRFPNYIKNLNLYFTGAWVTPGGGISGVIVSATEITSLILKKYKIKNQFQNIFS